MICTRGNVPARHSIRSKSSDFTTCINIQNDYTSNEKMTKCYFKRRVKSQQTHMTTISSPFGKASCTAPLPACCYSNLYMETPRPYLKVDMSVAVTDPVAVTVTLGTISFMTHAEMTPSPLTLALMSAKGAL